MHPNFPPLQALGRHAAYPAKRSNLIAPLPQRPYQVAVEAGPAQQSKRRRSKRQGAEYRCYQDRYLWLFPLKRLRLHLMLLCMKPFGKSCIVPLVQSFKIANWIATSDLGPNEKPKNGFFEFSYAANIIAANWADRSR